MEVSDYVHAPAALSLEKETVVPIGEKAGWTRERLWIDLLMLYALCQFVRILIEYADYVTC
jgi:hypothetical protein